MKFLIDALFTSAKETGKTEDTEYLLQVATATLLLEVMRADFEEQQDELDKIRHLLSQQFKLNADELAQIMAQAGENADRLVSLQHITRQMNEQLSELEKVKVIEMMWQVVFADGHWHHYEEHLIRQIAELLYLPHSAFIQARHKAEAAVV